MKDVYVSCQIEGTGFFGRLGKEKKNGDNLFCRLDWLSREADVKTGMFVVSSGFPIPKGAEPRYDKVQCEDCQKRIKISTGMDRIPGGLKLGVIREVKKNEKTQEAVVELSAPWRDFKFVTVLKKKSLP